MALKVWLNGSMRKINTNLHKPVIFLNNTKYKLDKAYTFVNGQRYQIWGESGVQIDYIKSTDSLGVGRIFAIGDDWMDVYRFNEKFLRRIDISDLSNPIEIESQELGRIIQSSGRLTGNGETIFYTEPTLSTHNKIKVKQDGTIENIGSFTSSGNTHIAFTDSYVVDSKTRTYTATSSQSTSTYTIGSDYYWDSTVKYSTGSWASGNTDLICYAGNVVRTGRTSSAAFPYSGLEYDSDNVLLCMRVGTNKASYAGLYKANISGYQKINDMVGGFMLVDGNVICRCYNPNWTGVLSLSISSYSNTFAILDKNTLTTLYTYTENRFILLSYYKKLFS